MRYMEQNAQDSSCYNVIQKTGAVAGYIIYLYMYIGGG